MVVSAGDVGNDKNKRKQKKLASSFPGTNGSQTSEHILSSKEKGPLLAATKSVTMLDCLCTTEI